MRSKDVAPILVSLLIATSLVPAQEIVNLFDNPGFEEGTGTDVQTIPGWGLYAQSSATGLLTVDTEQALEGKKCVFIEVTAVPAGGTWNLRFEHTRRFAVKQGETYTMSFWLKGDAGPITLSPSRAEQNAAGQWGNLAQAVVRPTPEWKEYYLTFVSPEDRLVMWQLLISNVGQTYYVDHARCYVGEYVPDRFGPKLKADSPSPPDKATDVPRDAVLGWAPGEVAATHDVYFGTAVADVNAAGRTDQKGVLAGQGQAENAFDPAGLLAYGQTYYWRIDEVNKAPDNTIFKGDVWSFTVEPYGYPVKPVKATASSSQASMGPEKTIDGSGMTGDRHGTVETTMWLSLGAGPNWIQYEFDQVYPLHEMQVWNSNQLIEGFLGFGAKSVTVETSLDGTAWTPLASVPEFSRAAGLPGYAANTTVQFGGVGAKFVKLTITASWGGMAVTGLAEVRFSFVPVQARAPQPANGATGVSLDTSLNWRPGRQASSHEVFLGTDPNALAKTQTVTDHSYTPSSLNFGTTYYWRVNEVNAVTYPGPVWSFTTQPYVVVEDFESYTDDEGNRIYETWIDGWTNGTGAVVGYLQAPFAERTIRHGGAQSMPLEYNNIKTPFYSEAERTFAAPRDWTGHGADALALWFQGRGAGFLDKGNNAYTVSAAGTDIWGNADQFRFVYKPLSGNGAITLRVDSIVNTNVWAKAGPMIRETLEAGSKNAYIAVTPASGVSYQWRSTTGGASANSQQTGLVAPHWVRLTRTGNLFKAERSADGKTWTQQGTDQDIPMATNVYIGMAVTSHAAALTTTAEISNVSTAGAVTGPWQAAAIGAAMPTNAPAPLYLTVEDKAGKKATAIHTSAAATNMAAWTEWRVPFTDLSGVNLAAVKKLTIGVGDRSSPKAGGAGMLYLDDIAFGHPVP
ncbi:MAG: carbohydrate binding domain-containing protein [Planctomycetes bacterium]|jgi:hypothetical protein|nr:carbohydrate binding domain-containing protein [Planctomycetota bacterium]